MDVRTFESMRGYVNEKSTNALPIHKLWIVLAWMMHMPYGAIEADIDTKAMVIFGREKQEKAIVEQLTYRLFSRIIFTASFGTLVSR